jgi:ABC-type phosphate transport system permease subunit
MSANLDETLIDPGSSPEEALPVVQTGGRARIGSTPISQLSAALIPFLTLATATTGIWIAILAVNRNTLESYPVALLGGMCLFLQLLFVDAYRQHRKWDLRLIAGAGLAFVFLLLLRQLPEFITGLQINAVVHRSIFSIFFLFVVCVPALSWSLFYLLGATPRADDISRYPLIFLPVLLAIGVYFALIGQLLLKGLNAVDPAVYTTAYTFLNVPEKYNILGDWPAWRTKEVLSIGILNHILGTGLLMLLTTLIALPIGVGAGIYFSEYGDGPFGKFARFVTSSLRAVSMLILAVSAYSLAYTGGSTFLEPILRGTYFTGFETASSPGGSYLTASIILSLLIIPVIARVTEEGCRSLPADLREGSLVLGASEMTTLRRIVLPWALPNIVTALLLGNAEVAGNVTILIYIAGRGMYGVGLFKQVTSLAYLIFNIYFGDPIFRGHMQAYQFQAGVLLLLICLGLGIAAIVVKNWLSRRFRGA